MITPYIILLHIKSLRIGLILLSSLALLSFSNQVIFFQIKKYDAAMSKQDNDFREYYYVQPFTRCNTYFIGIIFCLIYLSSPKRKMSSFVSSSLNSLNLLIEVRYIRYILFLGGCFLSIFFIFAENFFDHSPTKQPQVYCTLFLLFYRIGFTFGIALIIYPIILGYIRPLKFICAHPVFNVMGKLTYGCYMVHILIYQTVTAKLLNKHYFNFWIYLMDTIFGYCLAYIISFLVGMLFEIPISQSVKTGIMILVSPTITKEKQTLKKDKENLLSLNESCINQEYK